MARYYMNRKIKPMEKMCIFNKEPYQKRHVPITATNANTFTALEKNIFNF